MRRKHTGTLGKKIHLEEKVEKLEQLYGSNSRYSKFDMQYFDIKLFLSIQGHQMTLAARHLIWSSDSRSNFSLVFTSHVRSDLSTLAPVNWRQPKGASRERNDTRGMAAKPLHSRIIFHNKRYESIQGTLLFLLMKTTQNHCPPKHSQRRRRR